MTSKEQLDEWVKGNSIHNKERDECCPDFSCCTPELLAPEEKRKEFAKAWYENDQITLHQIMLDFLILLLDQKKIN